MWFRRIGRRQLLEHLSVAAGFSSFHGQEWQRYTALASSGSQGPHPLGREGFLATRLPEPMRDLVWVADRKELASLGRSERSVYLVESGTEGVFRWVDDDVEAYVSRDLLQGIFVPSQTDVSGASGAWVRVAQSSDALQLGWFGAKFDLGNAETVDAATDDTITWNAALSYLRSIGGGTLVLPPGVSKVTSIIDIPCDVPIRIIGTGQRKNYPDDLVVGKNEPSTVVPLHSGRCAFRFLAETDGQGGFVGENWSVSTLLSKDDQSESDKIPDCAFGWDCGTGFYYGATFRNMSIHCFRKSGAGSAFESYCTDKNSTSNGAILIEDCNINFNNWIWRNLDESHTNGLRFIYNKAGKNGRRAGRGGILARGANICINDNVLESNEDAIVISGPYASVEVKGNYFEGNSGSACIYVRDAYNVRVGPNNYTTMDYGKIDHKVKFYATANVDCLDPYWPKLTLKAGQPRIGNANRNELKNASYETVWARCDSFNGYLWGEPPDFDSTFQNAPTSDCLQELDAQRIGAMRAESYTTSGSGSLEYSAEGELAGRRGDWLCMSWLLKRVNDTSLDPYIILNDRQQEYNLYYYSAWFRKNEWGVITTATRLFDNIPQRVFAICFPYGINPPSGLTSHQNVPFFYVVNDVNKIRPFLDAGSNGRF